MRIVKLNAIKSTSTYLKNLAKEIGTSNWTVVTAEFQTNGRGQVHSKWESESGKNLMVSILIKLNNFKIKDQFYLNCAISLGIYKVLQKYNLPQLKIKWPNDIMAENKKIGGILIENSLMNDAIYQTVVGIGLNINQEIFSKGLTKAISMKNILKTEVDRDTLLLEIIDSLKDRIDALEQGVFETLHQDYKDKLFKKGEVFMFEEKGNQFSGIILGVTTQGLLIVEKENQVIKEYNFKEVKFL